MFKSAIFFTETFLLSDFVACITILMQAHHIFVIPGAESTSCHHLACPTQGPCGPAGDPDRAAETSGQTYKPVFNGNPNGKFVSFLCFGKGNKAASKGVNSSLMDFRPLLTYTSCGVLAGNRALIRVQTRKGRMFLHVCCLFSV